MQWVRLSSVPRWFVVPAAALALSLAAQTAQAQEGSFERTLKVSGAVDVAVRAGSGGIRVLPGPADTVRVVGRIRADNSWFSGGDVQQRIRQVEQKPPVEQQGNSIRIGWFNGDEAPRGISVSFEVTVPASTTLDAKTGSGSVSVGEIAGAVKASSGSGSLEIGRVGGAVTASAGSGSIDVKGAASLDAHTGSGSIRAEAIAGSITAKSGSGSIRIGQIGPGDVDVSASSGGVTLVGVNGAARVSSSSGSVSVKGRPAGPWTVRASSGSITVWLPPDASFDLDAWSNSGHVETSHPVTVTGSIERHRIRGRVRNGGPLVEVHASSGSVRIE